jgi:hypothetical protein
MLPLLDRVVPELQKQLYPQPIRVFAFSALIADAGRVTTRSEARALQQAHLLELDFRTR